MKIGRYQLLAPQGAGLDGASYRAEVAGDDGTPVTVEIRLLDTAQVDSPRRHALVRRLKAVRLLRHPNAVGIREMDLAHDPPFVALEWAPHEVFSSVPANCGRVVMAAEQLAGVLAEAHRLGLAHVGLDPLALRGTLEHVLLDFTGLEVGDCNTPVADAPGSPPKLLASCRAPEESSWGIHERLLRATPEGNLYNLGAVLFWLLSGAPAGDGRLLEQVSMPGPLRRLVTELLAADPDQRPTARAVLERLLPLQQPLAGTALDLFQTHPTAADTRDVPPERLGRYRLLEKLGQGGMGTVYRAADETDGTVVALKVLRSELSSRPEHLRRFHKEARLLAEVKHPNVVNLLEINEDNGVHYLVMEYVDGPNLEQWLARHGRMEEGAALALLAEVCRGLDQAHQAGIIHRDIKPANILLAVSRDASLRAEREPTRSILLAVSRDASLRAEREPTRSARRLASRLTEWVPKLTDFGLARHVVESDSLNLTQAGAMLGTPHYMSPEQCGGEALDARSDVYALGATLFHLLAGRPPYEADTVLALIGKHRNDTLPDLRQFNPAVSEAVCHLAGKAMARRPDARYADAGALLGDLERLLRGEPSSIALHPLLPDCDPARVLTYDFSWQLEASPAQLWPHVSNTERLNRAIGLSAVAFSSRVENTEDGKHVRRFGHFRKAGMNFDWEEHPFEWVEARRMGVLREYSSGPFRWMTSVVELEPRADGGTTLLHRLRLEPRGLLGRTLAAIQVGGATRRALDQVYRRIDRVAVGKAQALDPFEDPPALSRARRKRLEGLLDELSQHDLDPAAVERFGDFLATAPAQEVARIRPLALARRLALPPEALTAVCLHGARAGLLVLLWDILCPVCRIPAQVIDTLKALREHGRCDACQVDFELDFAGSVEMIFRAHPEVRDSELATYCVGGPAHSPHVVAQTRVGPGERVELALELGEGAYRLRGPQLPFTLDFRVEAGARVRRWDLPLARPPGSRTRHVLAAGHQALALTNEADHELLVRVERTAARDDALTAARASSLALFRELFPGEALAPGQLISVTTLTFLVSDLEQPAELYARGDAQAFGVLHEYFRLAREQVIQAGGAVVKTVGEGLLAVFTEPEPAVRAALDLSGLLAANASTRALGVRIGVHRGAALAATINDQLDYFGATLSQALRLTSTARGGQVVLTQAVAGDARVAGLLTSRGLKASLVEGPAGLLLHQFETAGGGER